MIRQVKFSSVVLAWVLGITICLVFTALASSCAKTPPNLTPAGAAAFRGTQAIKALDLLRDAAVDANATTPPLVTTATTRAVVTYHKAAITTIHAAPQGWEATVSTGLDQLLASLPAAERPHIAPYAALIKTIIQEATK